MRYDVILFDLDDTLLDFGKSEDAALKRVFGEYGIELTEEIRRGYLEINLSLWKALERGEVTKPDVLALRFQRTFERFGIDGPKDGSFERDYQRYLGEGAFLADGAWETLEALKDRCHIYVVTNGVTATQANRMKLSGLDRIVEGVFVSEEIGVAKPQKGYFDVVFERLGEPDRSRVLIVGDSLTSDIRGGETAGIDACWLNPKGARNDAGVPVAYEIRTLAEVIPVAEGKIPKDD